MKKIEKEIKNNSTKLIESSLPEITSLDNLPMKSKKKDSPFLFILPLGAITLAIAALLIPTFLTKNNGKVITSVSNQPGNSEVYSNIQSSGIVSNHSSETSMPINNNHFYNYNLVNYQPTFETFDEVAYYSYILFNQGDVTINSNSSLYKNNVYKAKGDGEGERQAYDDEYGRRHYPIQVNGDFEFSNFLFFEFDSAGSLFLQETIGNGHIYGLAVQTNIFDEQMLILKNGEHYYTCLTNGAGGYNHGSRAFIEFSAHKTIEGFDLVKDITNKRALTLYFGGEEEGQLNIEALEAINIEGFEFSIPAASVYYDNSSVICSIDALADRFGLDPNNRITNKYGKQDQLVYAADQLDSYEFSLDEFEGTFKVENNELYLDETEILNLYGATKIYASDINKDGYREVIFECYQSSKRRFVIYDVYRDNYLFNEEVEELNPYYDYYLLMKDDRLVVGMYEPGTTDNEHMLDYGFFAYIFESKIGFAWNNMYELSHLSCVSIYYADSHMEVEYKKNHYLLNSGKSYIVEIELCKYYMTENDFYPGPQHQMRVAAVYNSNSVINPSTDWTMFAQENGIYRFQISFDGSGYATYRFSFYKLNLDLKFAVDVDVEAE